MCVSCNFGMLMFSVSEEQRLEWETNTQENLSLPFNLQHRAVSWDQLKCIADKLGRNAFDMAKSLEQAPFVLTKSQLKYAHRETPGFLKKLRQKQGMIDFDSARDSRMSLGSVKSEVSVAFGEGTHIFTAMIAGFVVFWYCGRIAFSCEYTSLPAILSGTVGMTGALLVESWLYVLRAEKQAQYKKQI